MLTEEQREEFWSRIEIREAGCWPWIGHINRDGYGEFKIGRRKRKRMAHILSFEEEYNPVPTGLFVCHSCDVRHCVNFEHLFLGTCADNWRDMFEKGRHALGERQWEAKITGEDVYYIRRFRSEGVSATAIAQWYGLSVGQVCHILRGDSWKHIPVATDFSLSTNSKGEQIHTAKLTASQIPIIRQLRSAGMKPGTIGKQFGVQAQTIRAIMTGRNWTHIP